MNQAFGDFEFLIVDDASTDGSCALVGSYCDNRIRLIRNKQNIGQARSLKYGIKVATGEYIARLDQDDIAFPERLEKQVAFLDENPNVAVVGSFFMIIDADGKIIRYKKLPVGFESNLLYILRGSNPVAHPATMYRRNVIQNVGNYREECSPSEDFDLWLRVYKNGYSCDNIPEFLTYYRRHPKQVSVEFKGKQRKNHCLAFYDFYTGLIQSEIDYNSIEQYLDILVSKSLRLNVKNIGNILEICLSLFRELTLIHGCNIGVYQRLYNCNIVNSYSKIFRIVQLLGLIRLLLKSNMLSTISIKPFGKYMLLE